MTVKILVADDSLTIQKVIKLAFSGEDAVIESVFSGDAAWELMRTFQPDIVLADVFMPGCSGYELCARIKEDPASSHIPVVLMAGAFEPFDEGEAARVRSNGYLTKPFDTDELIQIVTSLVKSKASSVMNEMAVEKDRKESGMNYSGKADEPRQTSLPTKSQLDRHVWESFLGPERVLDLFDTATLAAANASLEARPAIAENARTGFDTILADDILNAIAEKVLRRMSADVVREVAWEIVPEISEVIIRQTLAERNNT